MASKPISHHGPAWYLSIFFREFWGLVKLNVIFVLTCLPVVTLGAALSSFGHVLCLMVADTPVDPGHAYFAAFRVRFVQKLGWGLAALAAVAVLGVALVVYGSAMSAQPVLAVPTALALLGLLAVWGVGLHLFPLLAEDAPPERPLRQAAAQALAALPQTCLAMGIGLILLLPQVLFFPVFVPVTLLIGLSLPALVCAFPHVKRTGP